MTVRVRVRHARTCVIRGQVTVRTMACGSGAADARLWVSANPNPTAIKVKLAAR